MDLVLLYTHLKQTTILKTHKSMKNLILTVIAVCSLNTIQAQEISYKKWVKEAPRLEDSFFTTPKAKEVAETVLLYQQPTGGWPKNINFFQTPDNKEKALEIKNDVNASTIDNGATTTEIIYLSRLYNATHDETYKEAAIRGLDYLFEAQYENGGWPQFYPRPKGYYVQITYNDNAMINVMNLLRDVSNGKSPFTYLPESTRQKAQKAIDKGVECILKTQVKQHGKLTVWCAQHDRETFAPAKARAYELPSLSGAESANIVIYLMQLPNPSAEVIQSIESAVQWFKDSEIKGIKIT
jgi:PelA/Pel-15E family pectate lyase